MRLIYHIILAIVFGVIFLWGISHFHNWYYHPIKPNTPYFVVTDMVQCKGNICNAVLDMDDIAILVPYDSTTVHVGDTLYIVK